MKKNPLILQEPEPSVTTTELAASSVNLQLAAWTKTEDFGKVKDALTTGIFEAYTKEGIEIPFPQMDIHIKEDETKENVFYPETISPFYSLQFFHIFTTQKVLPQF